MEENNNKNMPDEQPENGERREKKDKIVLRLIEDEMKDAYVNYAMSVIVGRALPDARDGLKPVHRRILFAMNDLGMFFNKPFKKCARIVGEVLGKYHPHGDTAVYDSLVRMAQDFSLRYPLIKGQGNFGSIDGDNAAAMRYTEAKLNKLATDMLQDIDKDTVNFKENFDASLKEPVVLPNKLPNLLINGSSGIAVGMATNIPPHNIKEVCEGIKSIIDNPDISVDELMQIIPGPDFPTGGEVTCGGALIHAYAKGRGKVIIKAISHIEDDKIVITEMPYMVNKAELIVHIAELVKDKRILGIRNINDESDREGIRVVIDLKRDTDPNVILNQLYKYSRLKVTFGINLLALVNNRPKVLTLKEVMEEHIKHRKTVIIRRTTYDLNQAQKKLHILEGLLVALNDIDKIIAGIKKSGTVDEAKSFLMDNYSLTELQSKAILEMRLQKLASLEQQKIRDEHNELIEKVKFYEEILDSKEKVLSMIIEELNDIIERYGDERRSVIIPGEDDDVDMEDLIEEETVVVTMTNSGYVKRIPLDTYKIQNRGGKGVRATGMKEEDFVDRFYITSTHTYLLFFTDKGKVYWSKVYQLPEGSRQSKGKHIVNLLELSKDEQVNAIIPVKDFKDGYLFMATKKGTVKKTELSAFSNPRRGGIKAINLDEDDTLIGVKYTSGDKEILLATRLGQANRFKESDVRVMGRTARGVRGIRLSKEDFVIGMLAAEEDKEILTLTENGYGKRSPVSDYRLCNRGGKGVTNIKITDKNGPVQAVKLVDGTEQLMMMSMNGIAIRLNCSGISVIGRVTQGVRAMRLNDGDKLAAAAIIIIDDLEENGNDVNDVNESQNKSTEEENIENKTNLVKSESNPDNHPESNPETDIDDDSDDNSSNDDNVDNEETSSDDKE